MFVNRQRVLDRIRKRGTAVTALIAPAGYGKSDIAHHIARLEPSWAEVSASPELPATFADRVAAALGIVSDDPGSLAASITNAWCAPAEPRTLIIEDVECLEGDAAGLKILTNLISSHAPDGKLVLCARHEPGIAFADFAGPHLLTTVRREHLAFDEAEMRSVFAENGITDSLLFRISQFTSGWPLPALYFARVAREGNLEAMFESMDRSEFDDLFDYVDWHVLAHVPPDVLYALCASVAFDDLGTAEFEHLFGAASRERIVTDLTRRYQVADLLSGGRVEVCPLIRAVLRARHAADVRRGQLAVAKNCETNHEVARAAQCYLEAGEIALASDLLRQADNVTLEALCIFSRLPDRYDSATLACYPEVWAACIGARRLSERPDVLAHEANAVLESLPPTASDDTVNTIVALSALVLMDAGRLEDAADMLTRGRTIPADGPDDAGQLHLLAARATIDATRGRYDAAVTAWHKMQRHVLAEQTWFSQLLSIEIAAARARGTWEAEYQFIEEMFKAAQRGGAPAIIAMALAEGVFGAWLARDSDVADAYLTQFELAIKQHDLPGLLNFGLAALGRRLSPSRGGSWHWDAQAYLMSAADNDDPAAAADEAQTALALADRAGSAFLRVLARVTVAEKVPSSRDRRLVEAQEIAAEIDSAPLRESLARLVASGEPNGMLTPFVDRLRFRSLNFEPASNQRIAVSLADVTIRRDGSELTVSEGGWALIAALAVDERAVSRDMLCDRLWPDMPLESARNALKMCVRRTRQQLGDADAILSVKSTYVLGRGVDVDVRALPALRSAVARGTAVTAEIDGAEMLFERLKRGRAHAFSRWEWFAETERVLQAATRELGGFLAHDALRRADTARALQIAEFLVGVDPLDEAARGVKIEAHLATENRGAAILEYQHYRKILGEELGVEPSTQLKELLSR
ncbi:MAG TPA: BTAD domain-containing putative transcriptional regulator [Candidatus Elarobacter sp.]|nr:BTAD domain-containing putative transcriptional regulator [Candidatus Elarobacter sp.]